MPRKNNPRETVERILSASMKLFHEKGFEHTSMQDIVDASDMSKGAIFYHFKSKEEVFEAAMEVQYENTIKTMFAWLAELKNMNAREKLIDLLRRNISDRKLVAANIKMAVIGLRSPHLLLANMRNNVIRSAPLVAGIIREGIEDGSFSTEYPQECAEVFLQLFNYWCDPFFFTCDMPTVEKRFLFLQQLMRRSGVDVVTDEIITLAMQYTEDFYNEVAKHG